MTIDTYTPDRWLIVKITNKYQALYKVFASWGGSYTYGESWKLNSGITECSMEDGYYNFAGHSGSIYRCRKGSYGTNLYTQGVLNRFIEHTPEGCSLEVLDDCEDWTKQDWS